MTDNPLSAANAHIDALLRHLPPEKTREILNNPTMIDKFRIQDADGNDFQIRKEARTRMKAVIPFIHFCQTRAGPKSIVPIHIPSLKRIVFNYYVNHIFDELNPTIYNGDRALRNWIKHPYYRPIPNQAPSLVTCGNESPEQRVYNHIRDELLGAGDMNHPIHIILHNKCPTLSGLIGPRGPGCTSVSVSTSGPERPWPLWGKVSIFKHQNPTGPYGGITMLGL